MKKIFAFASTFILLLTVSATAQNRQLEQENSDTTKRTALVIGNATYTTAPLKNPVNDAADIAAALRETGFEVIHRENLSQTDMKRAIRDFGAKLKSKGGVGLFYFAGHGVQVGGVNYLVPVDAKVESEEEVEYEAIDAGFVLAQMEAAKNPMNIVILDACRNNPFARSFRSETKGLAQMDAPSGTIIAYATAPGSVASDGTSRNGLYTQELLKNIRIKDLDIEEVFKRVRVSVRSSTANKQTPWESSSLTGSFRFSGSGASNVSKNPVNPPNNPPTVETRPSAAAIELTYWDSIKTSTNVADFEGYLRKYPNGEFADIARNKVKSLNEAAKAKTDTPTKQREADGSIGIGGIIPNLNAKVISFRFFESPFDVGSFQGRSYATRFPRSSRYVNWELLLNFPMRSSRTDFKIRAIYYDANNAILSDSYLETYLDTGWSDSVHAKGLGNANGYGFSAGRYRVEVFIANEKITSGWFEIY